MDGHGLPRLHVLHLCLLEVCSHPNVIHGNDGEQRFPGLNALADFNCFAANDSADRRIDFRITKIEFCCANVRLSLAYLAHARFHFGPGIGHLLWGSTCGPYLRLSLRDQASGLGNLVLYGDDDGAVGFEHLRVCDGLSRVEVRAGYDSLLDQPLIANSVAVGAGIYGFVLLDFVLCARQIRLF